MSEEKYHAKNIKITFQKKGYIHKTIAYENTFLTVFNDFLKKNVEEQFPNSEMKYLIILCAQSKKTFIQKTPYFELILNINCIYPTEYENYFTNDLPLKLYENISNEQSTIIPRHLFIFIPHKFEKDEKIYISYPQIITSKNINNETIQAILKQLSEQQKKEREDFVEKILQKRTEYRINKSKTPLPKSKKIKKKNLQKLSEEQDEMKKRRTKILRDKIEKVERERLREEIEKETLREVMEKEEKEREKMEIERMMIQKEAEEKQYEMEKMLNLPLNFSEYDISNFGENIDSVDNFQDYYKNDREPIYNILEEDYLGNQNDNYLYENSLKETENLNQLEDNLNTASVLNFKKPKPKSKKPKPKSSKKPKTKSKKPKPKSSKKPKTKSKKYL